ncbi:MAG: helix-turn-helix transcriptional regulator [Hydrocarboniphaga sp.]|uniref:helix-turn-helix transcriptional regulator n=1 Tax=Hydrocarboniphaga sp. TaxID=2033016 RepID=UPI002613DFE9|nr:helix-turn-helix transcriptional regulator [Hydrocarboniphaga sp.]MDB5971967.1 helix-turn-helix transcriptional regulator [Hydrocarboniphaga sp.]
MPMTAVSIADARNVSRTPAAFANANPAPANPEIDQLDRLIGSIYDGPMESPPWQTAMQLLRERLKAGHVTLMLRPPSTDSAGIMLNTGSTTVQNVQAYETHFFSMDPFIRLPEGEVVTAEELIGKQWLQSAVYLDFLKPLNIRHVLGADINTRDGIECRLRVTRLHESTPFSAEDKALCRLLLPHLKRSIQLHARLDFLECERAMFAGAVNRMQLGTISIDQNGNIIESNQEARRILGEKDGIWLSGNTLCVESAQESRQLQQMIRHCVTDAGAADGPGVVEALSVSRPSGRAKLGILVRAIPMGPFSESKQRPAAALFIRDPEASAVQPSQELVRRLFGLTRMEASLALLLTEGLTLDEAAEKMNVRRNTARTHLRSIFCKTGVTRQTMLVRLLLNSVLSLG